MGFIGAGISAVGDLKLAERENKYATVAATTAWQRSQEGATTQYRRSKKAALQSQGFQERMSSTAHQRGVADLRKAGLNPILSAMKGGASTPSGATASPQRAPSQMARTATMGHITTNAMHAYKLQSEGKLLEAQKGLVDENALGVRYANQRRRMFARIWQRVNWGATGAEEVAERMASALGPHPPGEPESQRDPHLNKKRPKNKTLGKMWDKRRAGERSARRNKTYDWVIRNF